MAARRATPSSIGAPSTSWTSCPKIKIEVVITDDQLPAAMEAIQSAARTGRIGDGKIFVSEIIDVVRIRTGEGGAAAI